MNLKIASVENLLISTLLFTYPLLALVVRGWVGKLFFLLLVLSIFSLVRSPAFDRSTWDVNAVLFAVAMASATLAVILSQAYHHDFKLTPYDEASRLLFAVPIYLAIRMGNFGMTNFLHYAFPLGAIIALVTVGLDPNPPAAGRLGSYFLNVIHFGDLALMLGFLSLFSIDLGQKNSLFSVLVKLTGLFAGLYLSIQSGSRGGWLAVPVLSVIWILFANNLKVLTRVLAASAVTVLLIIVGYFFVDTINQRIIEVYRDLAAFHHGNEDTSVGLRLQIWQGAITVFKENLLFGAGTEGYRQWMLLLSKSGSITSLAGEFAVAEVHNQILSYAVRYGIVGLVSISAVYFVPLVLFARTLRTSGGQKRLAGLMGICAVTGFLVFGMSVEIFNLKNTITFYSLTLACLFAVATQYPDELRSEHRRPRNSQVTQ